MVELLRFELEGLDCPNCAEKMVAKLRRLEGVAGASVDFASRQLTLEADRGDEALLARAEAIIRGIEPQVTMRPLNRASEEAGHEDHGHDHDHEHGEHEGRRWLNVCVCLSLLPLAAGLLWEASSPLRLYWFLAAWLLAGGEVLFRAGRNLLRGDLFDENFLMSAATIGAFALGDYPEGVAVMLFYQLGEAFQRLAVGRARRSVADLMDIRA
ncbi:MAG: cation transporter, partial [Oscillospiraceae bacterium]|nr:cation transporter [Oscillospiraceae bacterium]